MLPTFSGLLTVREVASTLKVSAATVYKLVHGGALPSFRVANSIRVHPDDLRAFIANAAAPAG